MRLYAEIIIAINESIPLNKLIKLILKGLKPCPENIHFHLRNLWMIMILVTYYVSHIAHIVA